MKNTQSRTSLSNCAYGIAVFSKGNNYDAITLTNCAVTGEISSEDRAFAIQIIVDAGTVSLTDFSVT